MEIQPFTPQAFEEYLRHTNEGLQVLRARGHRTVYAADRLKSHAAIATDCGIFYFEVASAGQIDWTESTKLLTYFLAGSSLGQEYHQNAEQDNITINLIEEIIKSAGVAEVRCRVC